MGNRETLLVVDDERETGEMIRTALVQAGFAAEAAGGGQEALDRLASWPADLVLSDVRMPGMSGPELIRQLRARGFEEPVVLLTGGDTRDLCTAATAYGAVACLRKPFSLDDLVWVIESALACRPHVAAASR